MASQEEEERLTSLCLRQIRQYVTKLDLSVCSDDTIAVSLPSDLYQPIPNLTFSKKQQIIEALVQHG